MIKKRALLPTKSLLLCLLCAALFSGSCVTAQPDQEKDSDFHYKMGTSYLNEGQLQTAFVEFQKALQNDPGNKNALNNLGLIHLQWGEVNQAKDLFLKAIASDNEFSDAYKNLGIAYRELGKWKEAIGAFKNALSNPLYQFPEWALYNLGVTYYRSGQFEPATEAFKDALKRSPSFSLPYYGLALVYNKTGRYGDASSVLTRAIELDSAYKGDREKFISDTKQRLLVIHGATEEDFKDYLEIMKY